MLLKALTSTLTAAAVVAAVAPTATALERPTAPQLESYRSDGTLARRAAAARSYGNHRVAPHLVARMGGSDAGSKATSTKSFGLPSQGNQQVLALLIEFVDHRGFTSPSIIDDRLFGDGPLNLHPRESLRDYYRRASYGQLEIDGSTLGWYRTPYPRRNVEETVAGREALIREVIGHHDALGHDFSRYDNDGDGEIDYFIVIWAGPHQEWAEFWWGYQTAFQDSSFSVDGVQLGAYSWQWEAWNPSEIFNPTVVIHETGHALGLPDYYDYDDSIGPRGGLGDLDMMDGNWGDHNSFSKFLLGWIEPTMLNQDSHDVTLSPSDESQDALLLMHGDRPTDPYAEYYIVQHRRQQGNDSGFPNRGLLVWHIDARQSPSGGFLFDNSYTEHKLIRLMEADGLEEIEQNLDADAGDYYRPGNAIGNDTTPSSHRYDGAPTNILVDAIAFAGNDIAFSASLGSGCAVYCGAGVEPTAWPGIPTLFAGTIETANCQGSAQHEWLFGDGDGSGANTIHHVYADSGSFQWSLSAELGDASCAAGNEILVCADDRCWQWRDQPTSQRARALHAAVKLTDGRVLVAGGGQPAEVFDPVSSSWSSTGAIAGYYLMAQGELLDDGRVLLVGSTPGDAVNAELYDPASDSWSVTGQLTHDRIMHGSVKLADGRVLVAGGYFFDREGAAVGVIEAELYDPATDTWSGAGSPGEFIQLPGLTLLPDGQVLLTGNRTAMTFDPISEEWSHLAELDEARIYHGSVALDNGRVLIVGGGASQTATIYDPISDSWHDAGWISEIRNAASVILLDSGRVLVAGGAGDFSNTLRTVEIFDPITGEWMLVEPMDTPRVGHVAVQLDDGSVLVTAGAETWYGDGTFIPTTSHERFAPPHAPAPRHPTGRIQ